MKQSTFKKMLLIATFALFTIASAGINYCFGVGDIDYGYDKPQFCSECGHPFPDEPEIETYTDQVTFQIHTYTCPACGYWKVFYVYPIPTA